MAVLIKLLRASTLDDLERDINAFFIEEGKDVRTEIDLAGGISFANDEYVAPIRVSAPHKRQFQTAAQEEETQAAAAEAEVQERANTAAESAEGADTGE